MGCLGCGNKRKISNTLNRPVFDERGKKIIESYSKHKERDNKLRQAILINNTIKNTKIPRGIVINNDIKNIQNIGRRREKINLLTFSKKGKHIFIIENSQNNESFKYMLRLIDKVAGTIDNVRFYYTNLKYVVENGFTYKKNPTIVVLDNGKVIKEYYGIIKDITMKIKEFSKTGKIETKTKQINNIENTKIFELNPDPTLTEAYNKLIINLQSENKKISNISTFNDTERNKLVVTVNYL